MAKKTAVDTESTTTQVNIADFQRTRDSVIVALATLQSSVQDLSRAYIIHANTVLAPGRGGSELNSNLTNILSESGLLTGGAPQTLPVPEDPSIGADGKKKRKRAPHDPNAPKRALTPYFLYMQSARTQIAKELGDNAKPKEVADEGTRRWTGMSVPEKAVWDQVYQKNLAIYRVRAAAYKAGQPVPDEEEAAQMVEAGKAPDHVPGEEAVPESEESTPEPPKEPEPPKSKRRKSEKAASPVKETPKSAAKNDKKGKKAKKEASPAPEPASAKSEKKKRSKKA